MNRVRLATGILAGWLVAVWTLPLCCLPMATMSMDLQTRASSTPTVAGQEHHHHHHTAGADTSILRLTSTGSCLQDCQSNTNSAVSATTLTRSDQGTHTWLLDDARPPQLDSSYALAHALSGLGPPGAAHRPISALLPLRI